MSYARFLAIFLVSPIVLLFLLNRRSLDRPTIAGIAGTAAIAVAYTTPWDNLIVINRVWTWARDRVVGITIWVVPIEEYTFFVLQTLFTSLVTITMLGRK